MQCWAPQQGIQQNSHLLYRTQAVGFLEHHDGLLSQVKIQLNNTENTSVISQTSTVNFNEKS
jgi:hypothetical protein